MVTVYSGANFTGEARCLKYYENSTYAGCTTGYYSFLSGIIKGLVHSYVSCENKPADY